MKLVSPGRARRHAAASSVAPVCQHTSTPCVLASHSPIAAGQRSLIMWGPLSDVGEQRHCCGDPLASSGEPVLDPRRPSVDQDARQDSGPLELRQARGQRPRRDGLECLDVLVEPQRSLRRRPDHRDREPPFEEARAVGGPPRGSERSYDNACDAGAGSSASSSTSSSVITGWKVSFSFTSSGTSSRSARLRSGRITSVSPAA